MGKKKGHKTQETKSKQVSTPVQIVEPELPPTSVTSSAACLGDVKLQRQMERELREAKEEEERKKAQAEKEKQEKKIKKSVSRSQKSTPTRDEPKPQNKRFSEPTPIKALSTSGEWNVDSTDNSENDKVKDNSYHESTQQRIKLYRDNNYDATDSENSPPKLQKHPYDSTNYSSQRESSPEEHFGNKDYQHHSKSSNNNNWRNDRVAVASPNYNTPDSYRKFSSKGSGYNWNQNQQNTRWSGSNRNEGHDDEKFQEFLDLSSQREKINYNKITEKKGDLFTAPEDFSLAHCVAEDMSMGAGIAKTFRTKFGQVGRLLNQRPRTGGLAVLNYDTRYIYYLVTKHVSRGKPTYYTLWQSLHKMKDHIHENNVNKLALPQIGCGLDRLEWLTVSQMLEHVFKDIDIEIVVYIWDETLEETPRKLMKKCVVIHEPMELKNIKSCTGLLYFGSVDSHETTEFKYLATHFNLMSYKRPKNVTEVLRCADRQDYYVYGLIIREKYNDQPDFLIIEKAIRNLKKMLVDDSTYWVGFQAFKDERDHLLQEKLIAMMQYIFIDVEIWVCWPEELQDKCPQQRRTYY